MPSCCPGTEVTLILVSDWCQQSCTHKAEDFITPCKRNGSKKPELLNATFSQAHFPVEQSGDEFVEQGEFGSKH